MFLFVGSSVFVLALFLTSGATLLLLTDTNEAPVMIWVLLVVGLLGVVFFGTIAIGIAKHHLGPQGDIALVLSPAGISDRTQIVGPLPVIPWSWVAQYDVVTFQGQPFMLFRLHDAAAYEQLLGSSKIMRWSFKVNSKIFRAPVHTITLQHLQDSQDELLRAIYRFTGFPPGPRQVQTPD